MSSLKEACLQERTKQGHWNCSEIQGCVGTFLEGGLYKGSRHCTAGPSEGRGMGGSTASPSFIYLGKCRRAREKRSTQTYSRDRARSPTT